MFWGLIMESGKKYTQIVERTFHVSMACLEPNTADNENVSVMLVFDNREFILCHLNKHKAVQTHLDLNFESGDRIAFMSSGKGRIHLTGYLLNPEEEEDDDDEDDDIGADNLVKKNSITMSDSPKKSDSVKATNKRKNEPEITKPGFKKVKLDAGSPGKSSSDDDDDDDDDDEDDDSLLGEESDDLLDGNEDEEDDDEDDDEEDSDEDDDESDDEIELETSKSKALTPKKDKQINKLANESQQNKNKSPNEKQKNRSLIEKQQKNKTPNEKQQQPKNKTPNEKRGGNTPHQKTPGSQMNGLPQQQQQSGKKNKKGLDTPKGAKTPGGGTPGKRVLEGGVIVEDVKVGNGPVAKPGRQVSVYYVGRLKNNNKQFDSATEGAGFKFRLGRGEVIKGWDIGVSGMKVGGKRKVVCPAALAYGNKGSPPTIPPNSTLVFDVELKAVN